MSDVGGRQTLSYGSWPTPITSALVVESAVELGEARADGESIIWSESRPSEGGRVQLVRRSPDGATADLLPDGHSARTAVHEYGGGAWWARAGVLWFASWDDQRLYRLDMSTGRTEPLTPEPAVPHGDRYADGDVAPDGGRIACVRERHPAAGGGAAAVRNEVVVLSAHEPSIPEVAVMGPDFVSSPRWSPDGQRLCWIEWDHPNMPWDGSRLVVRDLAGGGDTVVADGPSESVSEPAWQLDGSLTFISDRSGWWNVYRWSPAPPRVEPLVELEADIGVPQWVMGLSRYAVLADGRVVFARWRDGFDGLALRLPDASMVALPLPFSVVETVAGLDGTSVLVIAGTPTAEPGLVRVGLASGAIVDRVETIRAGRDAAQLGIHANHLSRPEPIDFRSGRDRTAHALYYPPASATCVGPDGELPPLLVRLHGGPTATARPQLQLEIQYWTSRGFAVVDVNYGGSTGYGRVYRDLLRGAWGVVDVEDCIAAARWLADEQRVDASRLCIRGRSAGGFTALAALARADSPFFAGADYFGVADLEALTTDLHKFESRYLDGLIGPYPEARELYRRRSPIDHVDAFARPLIVLQGSEDRIVPPSQSEMIVAALRAKGVPVAHLTFEGEEHDFRQAANIRRALEAELSFYAQMFGFELPPAEGIEPVAVENAPAFR